MRYVSRFCWFKMIDNIQGAVAERFSRGLFRGPNFVTDCIFNRYGIHAQPGIQPELTRASTGCAVAACHIQVVNRQPSHRIIMHCTSTANLVIVSWDNERCGLASCCHKHMLRSVCVTFAMRGVHMPELAAASRLQDVLGGRATNHPTWHPNCCPKSFCKCSC